MDNEQADPSNNEFVLLRVQDFLYLQYNRAKDFNAGTSQHQDKVVVVIGEGGQSSSSSILHAGLGVREISFWKGMTIQVCSLMVNPSSMDYAEVAVYPTGSLSTCTFAPSSSPSFETASVTTMLPVTPAPSLQPSPLPTRLPSLFPATLAPSPPLATVSPTVQPTPRPVTSSPLTPVPIVPSTHPSVHFPKWVQIGDSIDGEAANDKSGFSVALSSDGTIVAVGANFNDGGAGVDTGHVRVHANVGGIWSQLGNDLEGQEPEENFGYSVALSAGGTIVAVGSRWADTVNGPRSGKVTVLEWNGSDWDRLGPPINGGAPRDEFGYSVALSDDGAIVAAGGPFKDSDRSTVGHVRVFTWTGTDWIQRGNDLDGSSTGDWFGDSVSLSSDGSTLACGGDQFSNSGSGYVRVYHWSGSTWIQEGSTLAGFSSNDGFGESVSLSGDGAVLAVGADRANFAVLYRYDGTDWFQIGQIIRGGPAPGDRFGLSLSLSFDGETIVIGGPFHDSNGANSGHALVFSLSPNRRQWLQVGQELFGEAAADRFGVSVSISADGTTTAVGANGNDGTRLEGGRVQVFGFQ